MESKVVCVLGMHRSGTSLATRLLNYLGVYLGPEAHLVPPNSNNPKGFWEHSSLFRINKRLLATLGGHSHCPPKLSEGWERSADLDDLRDRAREVIRQEFSGIALWGWKDPRTCVTLPFWQELLPEMDYVLCIRHPLAVARSLQTRDAMRPAWAVRLWLIYVEASLRHTRGRNRMVLMYDDVVRDPIGEAKRLGRFLRRPDWPERQDVQSQLMAFTDSTLRHHEGNEPDLRDALSADTHDLLNRVYDSFCEAKESMNLVPVEGIVRSTHALLDSGEN